jgi:hypothetical protein
MPRQARPSLIDRGGAFFADAMAASRGGKAAGSNLAYPVDTLPIDL